jgi:hypothetical protein
MTRVPGVKVLQSTPLFYFRTRLPIRGRGTWKQKRPSMCTNCESITKSNQTLCSHNTSPLFGYCINNPSSNGYSKSSRFNFMHQVYIIKDYQCQGRRTPDWPDRSYAVRSCRPSSPVRLFPSTAGLIEREREREIRSMILA